MDITLKRWCIAVLLLMVSMGLMAKVDVKIEQFTGGTITASVGDEKGGEVIVTLTVAPDDGYTITKDDIEVYATVSPNGTRADEPQISSKLMLKGDDPKDLSEKRDYTVTVAPNFGVWVKTANFVSGSKGPNRSVDYSGTYYIASNTGDYYNKSNGANTTTNYYLCPTDETTWICYVDPDNYTNPASDNDQPFLTTYRYRNGTADATQAVWIIEKVSDHYYIKHKATNRYLTYNGPIYSSGENRLRFHLQSDVSDKALFDFTPDVDRPAAFNIAAVAAINNYKYINISSADHQSLQGTTGKTDGPTGYKNVGATIGIWNDPGRQTEWYLEPVPLDPSNPPTITLNNGTITITGDEGATIYYTTNGDTPTTSTTTSGTSPVEFQVDETMEVIKAIAVSEGYGPSEVVTYNLQKCERPVISVSGNTVTITCATEGATIYYTTNDTAPTTSSTSYTGPFDKGDASVVRAIAVKDGYITSNEGSFFVGFKIVHSSSEITSMSGFYYLASDFSVSGTIGSSSTPFRGTIDGQMNTIHGLFQALVTYADGATIKNVILDDVTISSGTDVGAICNVARGATRIYNCGVLATSSSTISGDRYVGGIVGLLDGESRVINCFSYADITGGTDRGGIVGYNNYASTTANIKTMVMNCMFYGNISTGGNISPVYGGQKITNRGDRKGLNNFNYFRYESNYSKNGYITAYNCALGAEDRYLTRYEFHRHILNSNRELAAWYAMGDVTKGKGEGENNEMAKWVVDKTIAPYPILKPQGFYHSVVNYDDSRNVLGSFTINIEMGDGAQFTRPADASILTATLTPNMTDKDPENYNYNYRKVQLPYYNRVGTKNCTGDRVVTGWKIVGVTGGTQGSYTTGSDIDGSGNTPYNFADRTTYAKDLYSVSGRVFSQGAYFNVPDGVTGITIQPYWGKAVYLSDPNYDLTYNTASTPTVYNVTAMGSRPTTFNDQTVYTTLASAISGLASDQSHTVYDYAVVLVGNYHGYFANTSPTGDSKAPLTIMSSDQNNDGEPDYSLFLQHGTNRLKIAPLRYDFINIPTIGLAQKADELQRSPSMGIYWNNGWFEVTNTAILRMEQMEFNDHKEKDAPLILLGGIYDQIVSFQDNGAGVWHTPYILVGDNAWFALFNNGCSANKAYTTPHVPISVTGGEYEKFYLSGYFRPDATPADDNAECYVDGGYFKELAGSGMEQIKGDVIWKIYNADIDNFYGGGINAGKPVLGSIDVTMRGCRVGVYCGGPKFGDMATGKKVTTNATNCVFESFYGAGYGGTSIMRVREKEYDGTSYTTITDDQWNSLVSEYYGRRYETGKGISVGYYFEYIQRSGGYDNRKVGRIYIDYASLSKATTRDVTTNLTGCTINTHFYGGGHLGQVNGSVTSTLKNCTVLGDVYGAGYSADIPTVDVMNKENANPNPYYDVNAGVFRSQDNIGYPETVTYTWKHANQVSAYSEFDDNNGNYILTTEDLTSLGTVTGDVKLNIIGTTTVGGSVYGGGALASSNTDQYLASGNATTTVNLLGGTITGDVYGGGLGRLANDGVQAVEALVGNTKINLNGLEAGDYNATIHNGLVTPVMKAGTEVVDYYKLAVAGCVVNRVFGCNNLNGTPKGSVNVHIFKTQEDATHKRTQDEHLNDIEDSHHSYEVEAVYGGGNLAAYVPVSVDGKTHVIIDGCGDTSIRQVYGGGNAASTPATQVDVNSTYEIEEVFGGGNGKDRIQKNGTWFDNPGANVGFYEYADDADNAQTKEARAENYGYGSGAANVNITGGLIHRVYGGSNTKGNVRIVAVTMLEDENVCAFQVDEAYGGGKSAPMDGRSELRMSCIPGLKVAYGGAEEADIHGDVVLTITNGNYDRVFGGNNVRGTIDGNITVNIEETGCKPVLIKQLYGGGNQAPYSGSGKITVNIKSFTSIGEVYGGGYGKTAVVSGDTEVNINECKGLFAGQSYAGGNTTFNFTQYKRTDDGGFVLKEDGSKETENIVETVYMPPHAEGAIGGINNVYGGGNEAMVDGKTNVNIGTKGTIDYVTIVGSELTPRTNIPVEGVSILGNVYGGGNHAEVTGNTNVVIGECH